MSSPLWNKKLKCPFCRRDFETTRMRSAVIKIKEKESDFGYIYDGECAYFYAVTACPHCTFSAFNKDFENIHADYEPKILEICRKICQSSGKKPDIFGLGSSTPEVAAKRHELALAFMKKRIYKDLGVVAGLHMHLVWIYRLAQNEEKEQAALIEAARAYEEYFEKGADLPKHLGEPGVLYLIGELNRRQGLYPEARHYYERALACREIKRFPRIANLVRDMMLIAKEQMQETGTN